MPRPQLWIVAGPNGSGKTSFTRRHLAGKLPIINPDEIARSISPSQPERADVAMQAGREAVIQRRSLLTQEQSFALETTFSGNSELTFMREAKEAGYKVNLIFIATKSPVISASRVELRVRDGGHFIPRDDIDRRYHRSIANLAAGISLADRAWLIDNSSKKPRLVATLEQGQEKTSSINLPNWVRQAKISALEQGLGMGL